MSEEFKVEIVNPEKSTVQKIIQDVYQEACEIV
jgi:uncharacterized protein (UPF0335 family)